MSTDAKRENSAEKQKRFIATPDVTHPEDGAPGLHERGNALLTRNRVLDHRRLGNIIIFPFELPNLNTTSYDARLGIHFYREQQFKGTRGLLEPFSEKSVRRYWGQPQEAAPATDWIAANGPLEHINAQDRLIVIGPGETILAHTFEFIGGRNCVSTEMRARSSMGRIGVTVCKCAGWGDLGYINRWTMEMTNHLSDLTVVLPAGMRVAQLIFYQVDPLRGQTYALESGKYQTTDDVAEMIRSWKPDDMIPKLYRDRDIGHFHEHHELPPYTGEVA